MTCSGQGCPASRVLATLAEIELAEHDARRIQQSRLSGGKNRATLDVVAQPGVPRARIETPASGDWLGSGPELIAVGYALVGAGKRGLHTRITDMVQKLRVARGNLTLEAALTKIDNFDPASVGAPSTGRPAGPLPPRRRH